MTKELIDTIRNIVKLDPTIGKDRVDLALSILAGEDPAYPAKSASQMLAKAGKIVQCKEAAKMLGVTPQCLRNWRKRENGLKPFVSPGSSRAAGYLEGDILDYIERTRGAPVTPCAV